MDNGKPYMDAVNIDVPLAAKCLRYFAGWADKVHGKTIPLGNHIWRLLLLLIIDLWLWLWLWSLIVIYDYNADYMINVEVY